MNSLLSANEIATGKILSVFHALLLSYHSLIGYLRKFI